MCPVYVTHVKTPSCFCIQLIGERTTKVLEALQEDMTVFYNSKEGDGYAIKEPYAGQVSRVCTPAWLCALYVLSKYIIFIPCVFYKKLAWISLFFLSPSHPRG